MSRTLASLFATALLAACPARTAQSPAVEPDAPLRLKIAQLEARRAGGAAELIALSDRGTKPERMLALRGLGRVGATGGAPVTEQLIAALGDRDPEIVAAAAGALGLAGSLDDSEAGVPGATEPLVAALSKARTSPPSALIEALVEALGRAGSAAAQSSLSEVLADPLWPTHAAQAALALGRHGRRKIALSNTARAGLVAVSASTDAAVRYAAVYALAREHQPPLDAPLASQPTVAAALVARLTDSSSETRAQAIAALGRRKLVPAARALEAPLDNLLLDRDWRVAVEAVRALADSDDGKDAIAAALIRRYGELERGEPTHAHVVIESVRALAASGRRPVVGAALTALASRVGSAEHLPALTRGWIACLATAALVRSEPDPQLANVARCPLPDHHRLGVVAQLIAADAGSLASRRAALAQLLGHADPRVRAAGLGAVAALWKSGNATDHAAAMSAVTTGLAAPEPVVASAAVEAATALYDALGTGEQPPLDAAVVARAANEPDPDLAASLLELIGKRALAAGLPACRAALGGEPIRAKAAAGCVKALGETPPAPVQRAAEPPPVDVTSVVGKSLRWRVLTSRGEVAIRLHTDDAPWAVATIVALTRRGFYDGLEFHRVVPNFVVQGGDPTESGSGGPGFAIPAEPGALADGAGYLAGGVGVADAGRDTGGSQWFIMHSRAPHLDGRYTWFGTVESGQKAADALLVGDRIVRATIEPVP